MEADHFFPSSMFLLGTFIIPDGGMIVSVPFGAQHTNQHLLSRLGWNGLPQLFFIACGSSNELQPGSV